MSGKKKCFEEEVVVVHRARCNNRVSLKVALNSFKHLYFDGPL